MSTATSLGGRTNIGGAVGAVEVAGQIVEVLVVLGLIAWGIARSRVAEARRPGSGPDVGARLPA